MTRVAVLGAKGRMGSESVRALTGAEGIEVVAEVDVDDSLDAITESGAEVALDFTQPAAALDNVAWCIEHGVNVVVGTSGFDDAKIDRVRALLGDAPSTAVLIVPNFSIGAVLMMRFAAEAARIMQHAEIIEYHHPAKVDAPSGTAARTAQLMEGEVPIHSVRLPGLVADQDVILGDVAQTLTIRHQTTDRTSFMPGVLLAVRHVAGLPESPTIGLEHLLWPSSP
jgi:4-hydroxy-tetrahydrodipicolinate reductase